MLTLGDVLKRAESDGDAQAVRFDPIKLASLQRGDRLPGFIDEIMSFCRADKKTAQMIAATHWGAYGLTGAQIYATARYPNRVGDFLNNAPEQFRAASQCVFTVGFDIARNYYDVDLITFARCWVGDANFRQFMTKMENAQYQLARKPVGELL